MSARHCVSASRTAAVATDQGLIRLEWVFDQEPEPGWVRLFESGVPRSGWLSYADVTPMVSGALLRIAVPDDDVELTIAWVDASIRAANERFDTPEIAVL